MAIFLNNELMLEKTFNPRTCRHSINGVTSVMHCHHFIALITQLAGDCTLLDAKALLAESAEDAFYTIFLDYFNNNKIDDLYKKFNIIEQFFSATGLGKMKVVFAGKLSGEVILENSHIDEGWIKKWGLNDKPINYIGCGFISAAFSAVFNLPARKFNVIEKESIACGAEKSKFTIICR